MSGTPRMIRSRFPSELETFLSKSRNGFAAPVWQCSQIRSERDGLHRHRSVNSTIPHELYRLIVPPQDRHLPLRSLREKISVSDVHRLHIAQRLGIQVISCDPTLKSDGLFIRGRCSAPEFRFSSNTFSLMFKETKENVKHPCGIPLLRLLSSMAPVRLLQSQKGELLRVELLIISKDWPRKPLGSFFNVEDTHENKGLIRKRT
jgi:hypothetical protein